MQTQSSTHLAVAKKFTPGLSERFNLFVKEREHSQASESDNSGEGAKDLVSIMECQVCLSMATRHPAAKLICRCYISVCKNASAWQANAVGVNRYAFPCRQT